MLDEEFQGPLSNVCKAVPILQIKFVILWLHHAPIFTVLLEILYCIHCRFKFSHILQKSIKSLLLTFNDLQQCGIRAMY